MLTLNDGRNELWQWDTGRKLTVDADCSQVHFSNKVFGRSIDVDVIDGVATIPDILLQTDKELNVWAFVGTSENGYTKISKTFKVNRRNKPADYVFTPPDQTSLEEIKERLENLESIQDPDAIKNAVEDYLEQNPVESPVHSVNGKSGEVELTAENVGADPAGSAADAVSQHNVATDSHADLRLELQNLADRVDAVLDSDDITLDELSEIVAYIKSNKTLIDAITTSKVSVTDIIDNLVTNVANKPLSAAQGVVLKGMIEEIRGLVPPVYTLPVGGNELGGVKNGGNVTINEDGTMTAPEVSGGSGIAVTGATVGQTVKIAAVDEEGVPTAWEPVDMPSEKWNTITYDFSSESVTSVIFELPSKKIKRGKLTITATQTGATSGGKSNWRLYADVVATSGYSEKLYVSGGTAIYTTQRTACFVWEALTEGFVEVNTVDFGSPNVFEKRYVWHVAQNYLYFVLLTDGAAMTGTATLLYSE